MHGGCASTGLEGNRLYRGSECCDYYRRAEGHYDLLPAMATDLIHRQMAVLTAISRPTALTAKAAATTIPIVSPRAAIQCSLGLASLNRPGGNVTSASALTRKAVPKRVELAHRLARDATVIGLLINPKNPNADTRELEVAAKGLRLQFKISHSSTEAEIDQPSRPSAKSAQVCIVSRPYSRQFQKAEIIP